MDLMGRTNFNEEESWTLDASLDRKRVAKGRDFEV